MVMLKGGQRFWNMTNVYIGKMTQTLNDKLTFRPCSLKLPCAPPPMLTDMD